MAPSLRQLLSSDPLRAPPGGGAEPASGRWTAYLTAGLRAAGEPYTHYCRTLWQRVPRTGLDLRGRLLGLSARIRAGFAELMPRAIAAFRRIHSHRLTKPQQAALFAALFGALAAGGFSVIGDTTNRVLRAEAEATARSWAQFLVSNVPDLPQIMDGDIPSTESVIFFEQARRVGNVYMYKIYDRLGVLRVRSDQIGRINTYAFTMLQTEHPEIARSLLAGGSMIGSRRGANDAEPSFLAEAYLPIMDGDEMLGMLGIYVDQTDKQRLFYDILVKATLSLGIILSLTFGIPGLGFWLRTRQKELAESRLDYLAHHDPLTQLANRTAFLERLQHVFASGELATNPVALHYLDLDHFKVVNDTHGHDIGDELLREVARLIRNRLGPQDTVARIGGDEFVVIQTGIGSRADAARLAEQIIESLSHPIQIGCNVLKITPSIGLAVAPSDAGDPVSIIKCADLALYFAKASGRACYRMFDASMREQQVRRRRIEREIRAGLELGRFELYFQPLYVLGDQTLAGFEALLRLRGETGEYISPTEFIPVAEDIGLIRQIGAWTIHQACITASYWPESLKVAVNLSPAEFRSGDIINVVRNSLRETGLLPQRLELEVTESLFLRDTEVTREQLESLKALGVSIVLDDFGTGYSSLNYLWRFPFDKLKIDRSFVQGLGVNENIPGIIRTIIALARVLGLKVTAEGVETQEQADSLCVMKCDQVQGYLFGRPMPAADIPALVLRNFTLGVGEAAEAPALTGSATVLG